MHVATGTASIPLLLVKLWSVYPNLFRWPPVQLGQARGRSGCRSFVLVVVRAGPAVHRLLQRPELVPVAVGLRAGAPLPGLRRHRLDPAAHRGEAARHQVRAAVRRSPTATCSPRFRGARTPTSHSNAGSRAAADRRRRSRAAGCWPRPAPASASSSSPRSGRRSRRWNRSACWPSASRSKGPQRVPVNRTAEQAQVVTLRRRADWTLQVDGPKPYVAHPRRHRGHGRARGASSRSPASRAGASARSGAACAARHRHACRRLRRLAGARALARAAGFVQQLVRRRARRCRTRCSPPTSTASGSTSTTAIRCG